MRADREHALIATLEEQLAARATDRRQCLRYTTTSLGMSAPAVYAVVAKVTGERLVASAEARGSLPKGSA